MPSIKTIHLQNPKNGKTFNFEMIRVEGGSFKMGGTKHDDEQPIHKVNVPSFHIGKYPVTQALYEFVIDKNPSHFKGGERPVEQVSWHDAKKFIEKLNKEYGNLGFRLLSEAEWEYAARGGKEGQGDQFEYSGGNDIEDVAWYGKNSYRETKPVGWKEPNQLGIYDMSGNVEEWCEDYWHSNYQDAPKNGSAWIVKGKLPLIVRRGGSWHNKSSEYCKANCRSQSLLGYASNDFGFRLGLP